jgi:uncharacterized oxidoreductase
MLAPTRSELETYVSDLLVALGTPSELATPISESLVDANSRGHSSHGVIRVSFYAGLIEDGVITPDATPVVTNETGALGSIDGRTAFGQVVGRLAVESTVERAREHGVAVTGIDRATHLGRVGEWGERAANEGLLFAAFVNSGGKFQTVAPAGSVMRRLSTNPIGFAVPTFEELPFPIVLDMATSQVAGGKIRERAANDEALPEGWVVEEDGSSVADPQRFLDGEGALQPMGGEISGYKGFGLAVISELFAGLVGSGPVQGESVDSWTGNVAMFFCVDPRRFTDEATIRDKLRRFRDHLEAAEPSDSIPLGDAGSGDRALLPGEPEYLAARESDRNGVPVKEGVASKLAELANEHGVSIPPTLDV